MKHLGDITKINGHEVPLVDIVTGGSPCQDLSVAGKRAGLEGERSGLFMEQIRIIKEMRNECIRQLQMRGSVINLRCVQPRYMVWENVPGAFSSNKGEDFRCVLEETAKIVQEDAVIPGPPKGGWSYSGCIMGDGWSIAWRLHDAQFWGVPQRRKRISLVADFGGASAPEILFEREGMSGDIESCEPERQEAAGGAGAGTDEPSNFTVKIRGGCERDSGGRKAGKGALVQTEMSATLGVSQDQTLITKCLNPWDVQSKHIQPEDGKAEALYSGECRGGGGESYVMQSPVYCLQGNGIDRADTAGCNGKGWRENESYTLNTVDKPAICYCVDQGGGKSSAKVDENLSPTLTTTHQGEPAVLCSETFHCTSEIDKAQTLKARDYKDPQIVTYGLDQQGGKGGANYTVDIAPTLASDSHGTPHGVVYGLDRASFNQGQNAKYDFSVEKEKAQTLVARGPGGVLARQSEPYVQETIPKTVGSLCASGYSKLGTQEAMNGMYIVEKKDE